MHNQKLRKLGAVALMAVVVGAMTYVSQTSTSKLEAAQTEQSNALLTPWGEPDLQGIWSVELLVPLERPNGVTTEFYTEEQVAELDRERANGSVFGNHVRAERGSEADVAGAYNAVFTSQRPTGRRTGMVIDPPDGKVPPLTPEARARQTELFEYQAALLQNTVVCRDGLDGCIGGTYGPRSPLRDQQPPYYSTRNINRANGPEDRSLGERCMSGNLPNFRGGFTGIHYRIVQSPGAVTIFYDVGQGQGFNRVIPITDAPHLPAHVRQWWGDSRGRWEGDTLVVDVTNFSGKTEFRGARENLRLIERWRRTGPETLEVVSTLEDSVSYTHLTLPTILRV